MRFLSGAFEGGLALGYVFLILAVAGLLFIAPACTPFSRCPPGQFPDCHLDDDGEPSEAGGSSLPAIHLPFPQGNERMCVQGADGDYSHSGNSTRHDLDLDTSNAANEEVYAPAGGKAYVHTENASTNFGYHVNIDLGDGSYVVVAHLKEAFVGNELEVAAGQLLGFEGCTGACQGDHVHLGRHLGDASLMAQYGTSTEVAYWTADASAGGGFAEVSGDDFVCGLKAAGDAVDGHFYESGMPVVMWHPDGTLVKSADNAKTYLLENGSLRWIDNEADFWSYHFDFASVETVSDEELACYGRGLDIATAGDVRAAFDDANQLWLAHTDPDGTRVRERVNLGGREAVLGSWGIPWNQDQIPEHLPADDAFFTNYPVGGTATFRDGAIVKENNRSDVYVMSRGVAMPVEDWNTYLLMGFADRQILHMYEGDLHAVMGTAVGDCSAGQHCIDRTAVVTCGGGLEVGDGESGGEEDTGSSEDTNDEEHDEDERDDSGAYEESHGEEDTNVPHDTDPPVDTDLDAEHDTAPERTEFPPGTLEVEWGTPFHALADTITLSGEYTFADGSYGFTWRELKTVEDVSEIAYAVEGASSGDRFRFSVEYRDAQGNVSWSCIGPYPPGTRQGSATADFGGTNVAINEIGDPSGQTTGCGLVVDLP